jgi:uncharacterized protein YdiU (UPF0061 family)
MSNDLLIHTLLDKLKVQEELLAEFYSMLIEHCPDYAKMWAYLNKQEIMHSKAVELLKDKFDEKNAYFNSELIHFKTLNYSIEFIQAKTSEIKNSAPSTMEMLEIALNLESNTMEAITFESISSDQEAMETILKKLQADTKNHKRLIEDAIKEAVEKEKIQSSGLLGKIRSKFH